MQPSNDHPISSWVPGNIDPEFLADELKPSVAGEPFMKVHELDISERDIKIGRGNNRTEKKHPGNVFFRAVINERFDLYDSMDKADQTELAFHIITAIKHDGRRFVKKTESGGWEEADDNVAREKISITFRSIRKMNKKKAERKIRNALHESMIRDVWNQR